MPSFDQFGQPNNDDTYQRPSQYGNRATRPQNQTSPYFGSITQRPNGRSSFNPNGAPQPQQPQQPAQTGWDANRVKDYYASRGVTPNETSPQYWEDRWNEWGKNDPQYFEKRLHDADEFTGGGQNSGGGGGMAPQAAFAQVAYRPGQLPQTNFDVYRPGQLTMYEKLNQAPMEGIQNNVLQQVLQNPSLSPEVVAQMQGQLKDQAAIMGQNTAQGIRQNYANRGYGGGGMEGADLQNSEDALTSSLLSNYRDIDINAAQTNYNDRLNALGMSNSVLGGQVDRNVNQWNALNQGQMQQEQLNQAGVQSQNAAAQFALQRALQQEGLSQAAAGIGLQGRGQDINSMLGLTGYGLGYAQLQNQMNQQAINNALDPWRLRQ